MTFEAALALMATVGSVGGLAGGLLVSTWGGLKKKRVYGVIVPIMISAVAMIGLGLSTGLIHGRGHGLHVAAPWCRS